MEIKAIEDQEEIGDLLAEKCTVLRISWDILRWGMIFDLDVAIDEEHEPMLLTRAWLVFEDIDSLNLDLNWTTEARDKYEGGIFIHDIQCRSIPSNNSTFSHAEIETYEPPGIIGVNYRSMILLIPQDGDLIPSTEYRLSVIQREEHFPSRAFKEFVSSKYSL